MFFKRFKQSSFKPLPRYNYFFWRIFYRCCSKKPISLTERRNRSGNKSREISSFEIKKEVKDCLAKTTRYFYMGHYAYIKSEDYLDAKIIKDQIAV